MCSQFVLQKKKIIKPCLINTVGLFFIYLLLLSSINAQYVSLSDGEIRKLMDKVKTDKEANKLFQGFRKIADSSLQSSPRPIQKISTAGLLQGNPTKAATKEAIKDFKIMYALAICYRLTKQQKYLTKAAEYFYAWATINQPSASPIDDTNLDPLIEAYDLLKNNLPKKDRIAIANWLKNTAIAEKNNLKMLPVFETGRNNWNSHRLKVVGEIAFAIQNKPLQQWTIEKLKDQIAVNLLPDGRSLDFILRDAVHYHVYDLEPLVRLSTILHRATTVDYFHFTSSNNSSIKKSVDWLIPFITKEKTHQEFVNSTVQFDQARSKNREVGHIIGQTFQPEKAIRLLVLCTYFNYPIKIESLPIQSKQVSSQNWQMLLYSLST